MNKKPRLFQLRRWLSNDRSSGASISATIECTKHDQFAGVVYSELAIRDCSRVARIEIDGKDAVKKLDRLIATLEQIKTAVAKAQAWRDADRRRYEAAKKAKKAKR